MSADKTSRMRDMDPLWLMRIFTVIPAALIILAGAGTLWAYFFVVSLLPESRTRIDIPALTLDVRVIRDGKGVPGIVGEREEDVALVLGYVMAQDRLWQMDCLRRAAQGRLSETLGRDYLEADHLMRTVGVPRSATLDAARLGPRETVWLDRFIEGVNTFMSANSKKLPVEFSLLEYRPEPFTREDVLGILAVLAWDASPARRVDPTVARLIARLGAEDALELIPSDPAASAGSIPESLVGWAPRGWFFTPAAWRGLPSIVPGFRGGCLWGVDGRRTGSGKPMTACSVFQTLSAPGFWYRARLVAGNFHLTGAFPPGVPVTFVGNNVDLSWGAVTTPADDADLFIESLDSDAAERYWRIDRFWPVRFSQETYRVRGTSSVTRSITSTATGPLVSAVSDSRALSLRWTGRDGVGLFPAFFALNRAGDGDEARTALESVAAPSLNVIWADSKGGYGIQTAGRIPVRPPGSDGIIPRPAWTGVDDWQGFIPFDELPAVTNPPDGICLAADGRPGGTDYPFFTGCYWNVIPPTDALQNLLGRHETYQPETFQAMQNSSLSPAAAAFLPAIRSALEGAFTPESAEGRSLAILASWDGRMSRDSTGAAIFGLTYQALLETIFLERLGEELFYGYTAYPAPAWRILKQVILEGEKPGPKWPSRTELLKTAFSRAIELGIDRMGPEQKKWSWGAVHVAEFRHALTDRSRFLELLYDVGPLSIGGGADTVDIAAWSKIHPFRVVEGVSLRQVADMTVPPRVFAAMPMGTSAHFFSSHYKDQTPAWLEGRAFQEPVHRADIAKSGFNTVIFRAGDRNKISSAARAGEVK